MRSRTGRWALLLAGVLALAVAGGTALASGGGGARIVINGRPSFKPNGYIKESFKFAPGTIKVRSGATVTLVNTTTDGHSLTIVKHSQVPRTIEQVENCSVCEKVLEAHGVNLQGPPSGPPPHPQLDVGAAGFNQPGDSTLVAPKGSPHSRITFKVTAKPGTTLNFICAFHAWMQGRIVVTQ